MMVSAPVTALYATRVAVAAVSFSAALSSVAA